MRWLTLVLLTASLLGCGRGQPKRETRNDDRTRDEPSRDRDVERTDEPPRSATPPVTDTASATSKLVYLVSVDNRLFSFDPRVAGTDAYRFVGRLRCPDRDPQSMAVDRHGSAWVFYNTGRLYRVSLADASCAPTTYLHPSNRVQLGMGFTSVAAGSDEERLYVINSDMGLTTVDTKTHRASPSGQLKIGAELTGGGDGRLFSFDAQAGRLSEVDQGTLEERPIHTFVDKQAFAWAFARYAGKFYVFTAGFGKASRTTIYDPLTNTETLRDENIGFVIVGAGQSTLVPLRDGSDGISGRFDEEPAPDPSAPAPPAP